MVVSSSQTSSKRDVGAFLTNSDDVLAHLNYIMLSGENLSFTPKQSGFEQVPHINLGDEKILIQANEGEYINIEQNGYMYIFVSNSSLNKGVRFDDLLVNRERSALLEETHYYPFGLAMSGISSKAASKLTNKLKFNEGTELENSFDVSLYETPFRSYDAQIGRFHQIDPLSCFSSNISTYSFVQNNPILRNDPLGLKDTIVNGQKQHIDKPLKEVVVTSSPIILKKGRFNNFIFKNIKEIFQISPNYTLTISKMKINDKNAENYFKTEKEGLEKLANLFKDIGDLGNGGLGVKSVKDYKDILSQIRSKTFKLSPIAIGAAFCYVSGMAMGASAEEMGNIASEYEKLHSTAYGNLKPTKANGVYLIKTDETFTSSGMNFHSITTGYYYDIATGKFLGEIKPKIK